MIQERSSETTGITIGIKRGSGLTELTIETVPITPSSIRRFRLMEEDFVRLDFSLAAPIHFAIGDHIDDPIFGRFVITHEQMPKYNTTTGGYDYQLQFDAPYIGWRNRVFMLTATTGSSENTRIRKEASWTLTAKLADHAGEIIRNLKVLGQTYTVSIDSTTATHAGEVRCLQYSGVSILQALGMMAEEYECEWWVTGTTIHFGRCISGDEIMLSLGTNIESMNISDNRNTFASKVYVYGSQTNMPPTYRKKLSFTYTDEGSGKYKPSIALTSEMFAITGTTEIHMPDSSLRVCTGYIGAAGSYGVVFPRIMAGQVVVTGTQDAQDPTITYTVMVSLEDNTQLWSKTVVTTGIWRTQAGTLRVTFQPTEILEARESAAITIPAAGTIKITIVAAMANVISQVDPEAEYWEDANLLSVVGSATIEPSSSSSSRVITCTNGTDTKTIRFNPSSSTATEQHGLFSFISGSANVGETLTIDDDGVYNVPTSFYVTEYDDQSSLASIGANRLRMPAGDYLLMSGVSEANAVERVVVFDDIYPDGKLKVTGVTTKQRTSYTEYEGEIQKAVWQWKEYVIEVEKFAGGAFRFSTDYILANTTLQVRFLTPEDVEGDAQEYAEQCLLAGMTFEVAFNRASGTFTIVRNDDYGALLPNETLYPKVGDPLVIIGWNSKAIANLGLIDDAEQRLQAKGEEYMAAMEQGQFTFDCTMMSDFMFWLWQAVEWHTEDDEHITSSDGWLIFVRDSDTYDVFAVPTAGMAVCIHHEALQSDKHSRVIGYEFKLDKPYDSPKLTIGETDRYSRLAQLEKQITTIK